MDSLNCMNCQAPVEQADAKLFAGVFVCPTCHMFAERLFRRSEAELKQLLVVLQDAIRIALIEGRLTPMEGGPLDEIPKQELLRTIVKLQETRDAAKRHPSGGSDV